MSKFDGYIGGTEIGSGLTAPNGLNFPLVAADQIQAYSGDTRTRLDQVLRRYDNFINNLGSSGGAGSGGAGSGEPVELFPYVTPLELVDYTLITTADYPDGAYEVAVHDNDTLEQVVLPSFIGDKPVIRFLTCWKMPLLKHVVIPNTVTEIKVASSQSVGFFECPALEILRIPSSVTTLAANTFRGGHSLKQVYIPSSVTTVGMKAFGPYDNTDLVIQCQHTSEDVDALPGWHVDWNAYRNVMTDNVLRVPVKWSVPVSFVTNNTAYEAYYATASNTANHAETANTAGQADVAHSLRIVRIPLRQSRLGSNGSTQVFYLKECPDFNNIIGLAFDLKFFCENSFYSTEIPIYETCFGQISLQESGVGVVTSRTLSGYTTDKDDSSDTRASVAFSSQIHLEVVRDGVAARVNVKPILRYLADYKPNGAAQWDDWDENSIGLRVGDIVLIYGESSYISPI